MFSHEGTGDLALFSSEGPDKPNSSFYLKTPAYWSWDITPLAARTRPVTPEDLGILFLLSLKT
jgi:hypothetical protein